VWKHLNAEALFALAVQGRPEMLGTASLRTPHRNSAMAMGEQVNACVREPSNLLFDSALVQDI